MVVLVLQPHWRTVALLVLDVVALPEWHGDGALVLAATELLMLLLSLVVARSLGGMIVCALALSLLQVAMVERQKRLVRPGELVHVLVVGPERLVEEQKLWHRQHAMVDS